MFGIHASVWRVPDHPGISDAAIGCKNGELAIFKKRLVLLSALVYLSMVLVAGCDTATDVESATEAGDNLVPSHTVQKASLTGNVAAAFKRHAIQMDIGAEAISRFDLENAERLVLDGTGHETYLIPIVTSGKSDYSEMILYSPALDNSDISIRSWTKGEIEYSEISHRYQPTAYKFSRNLKTGKIKVEKTANPSVQSQLGKVEDVDSASSLQVPDCWMGCMETAASFSTIASQRWVYHA